MTPEQRPEVRPYVVRLIMIVAFGVLVMAAVGFWAWTTYGEKLESRPAFPEGKPGFGAPAQLLSPHSGR